MEKIIQLKYNFISLKINEIVCFFCKHLVIWYVLLTEELLYGFFQYFSHFDFLANPMSVRTGKPITLDLSVLEKTLKVNLLNIIED